ncbi:MAG: 16S rRNA (cytidine(1402)-2'-O)-methyltransferase [Lachnospiraceae bacterium]|nr:16S rRNA (cytidine(1402)-2'-O)-methyltransferase [Lachnospiraceae bacterium]
MSGRLYLCATPIGNLEDITLRVLNTLREVDLIAAEDTRHSRILLEHYEITTPLTSYHEHNKYEKAEVLVGKMLQGTRIALITDAGTPAISDPGEELVRQALQAGIPVTSLPGACACITALTMSGLSTRRFVFEAFLPAERKERREVLERLKTECRTIVLYEAPHHLRRTLEELTEVLGDRRLTLCRELTKKYEEGIRTTLTGAQALYRDEEPRGEFVLVLEGRSPEELRAEAAQRFAEMTLCDHLQRYLDEGMERKEAMKQVARDRNCSRREVYQGLLQEEER